MKKLSLILLTVILCISFASCSDKNTDEKITEEDIQLTEVEDTSDAQTVADSVTDSVTETEALTDTDTEDVSYDWKSGVITVLSQYAEADAYYSLYDMTDDGTPELIVMSGTNAADTMFYLYDLKKSEYEFITFGSGNCSLCPYNGNIILQYCKMGYETVTEYSYDGKKLADKVLFERGEIPADEEYIKFEYLPSYAVNDLSGISWVENPTDTNAQILENIK